MGAGGWAVITAHTEFSVVHLLQKQTAKFKGGTWQRYKTWRWKSQKDILEEVVLMLSYKETCMRNKQGTNLNGQGPLQARHGFQINGKLWKRFTQQTSDMSYCSSKNEVNPTLIPVFITSRSYILKNGLTECTHCNDRDHNTFKDKNKPLKKLSLVSDTSLGVSCN